MEARNLYPPSESTFKPEENVIAETSYYTGQPLDKCSLGDKLVSVSP
ncbi:MAG: hypothetical protein CM15mP49_04050 [Actinomycetota bacterium]|nr:MAG: hypothetical protein CM15mP49_04050 [Actinomycetota bacterium]